MNMRNSLNEHIHTKCARNLAFIYQFYEKEDEEVWGPVYNHCHASEFMTCQCSFSFTLFPIKICNATVKDGVHLHLQ